MNRLVIERKDDRRGWVQVFEATDAEYRVGGRVRYRLRGPAVENPLHELVYDDLAAFDPSTGHVHACAHHGDGNLVAACDRACARHLRRLAENAEVEHRIAVHRAEYERDDARRNEARANGRLQTMREEVARLRLELAGAAVEGGIPGCRVLATGGILQGPRPYVQDEVDHGCGIRCFPSTADAMVLDDMGVGRPARVTDYTGTGRPMRPNPGIPERKGAALPDPRPNPSVASTGSVWPLVAMVLVAAAVLVALALTS